jgi:predicted ATPase/class 3 adenylate cyclase
VAVQQVPDGVITFLFTDIEGSTQRVHSLGHSQWLAVLEQHNAIVRRAIAAHGGYEVKTEGDAFFVTFSDAGEAVEACLEAQLALDAHSWPPGAPIRVRMGLHTGEAHLVDGDYVGLVVHEAARIAATGHGGQTVLSEATRLAAGIEPSRMRSLGTHALKDFPEPQELHQLIDPGLRASFPALKTLTAAVHNLPTAPTALLGRDADIDRCAELLLGDTRLLTLTGPGGIGKTRLALAVAQRLLAYFPTGVWMVQLAAVPSPDLIASAINEAVGVIPEPGSTPLEALTARLASAQPALLVLDNYEHLTEGALVVADLLAACANLSVLVTSRSRLRLRGERDVALEPLDTPSSALLFTARATEADPTVVHDGAAAAEICAFLEGMPLAIELAAARVRDLGVDGVRDGLAHSLDVLDEGAVDLPPRQQALRSTIAWSYDLLEPGEQRVFRQLGVFAGGMEAPAAVAVAGEEVQLQPLVETSLLRRTGDRFTMLETIRQYALEQLELAGETAGVSDRHGRWFAALAVSAAPELTGPDQAAWLDQLGHDHDNLRVAQDLLLSRDPSAAAAMTAALGRFWEIRGFWEEAGRRTKAAFDAAPAQDPARGDLLHWMGRQAMNAGDLDAAAEDFRESLNLRLRARDLAAAGRSADALGEVARLAGDAESATSYYESALGHFRAVGNRHGEATTSQNLATLVLTEGDATRAVDLYTGALALLEELKDQRGGARVLMNLGFAHLELEHTEQALELLSRSAALFTELGDREGTAAALTNLGVAAARSVRDDEALTHWNEALQIERDLGNRSKAAVLLYNLYELHNRQSHLEEALGCAREGVDLLRTANRDDMVAELLYFLGRMAWNDGDGPHALSQLQESAALYRARGELVQESFSVGAAAGIAGELEDVTLAQDLRTRVLACLEGVGVIGEHVEQLLPHISAWPAEREWLLAVSAELTGTNPG